MNQRRIPGEGLYLVLLFMPPARHSEGTGDLPLRMAAAWLPLKDEEGLPSVHAAFAVAFVIT
jgi:hypothetical protein